MAVEAAAVRLTAAARRRFFEKSLAAVQPEAADRTFIFPVVPGLYHPDSVRITHAALGTAARPLAAKERAISATTNAVGKVTVQVTVPADASFLASTNIRRYARAGRGTWFKESVASCSWCQSYARGKRWGGHQFTTAHPIRVIRWGCYPSCVRGEGRIVPRFDHFHEYARQYRNTHKARNVQ